ncbi:unnamed protein product [Bemisia tabaci]|uniref:CWF19-like protein 1 n=1 Tax=Bemisia tabaci TaxID=7038 RepID=A0A9P0ABR6_BEMTA|nr:unnamed protein product [Bemisia tabaci]
MAERQKILVAGNVNGNFKTLFNRINSIVKKNGPFDFMLCVGDFFSASDDSWEPYRTGHLKVPLPIYILGPTNANLVKYYSDLNGCELCPNVSYLGKQGIFRNSAGLRIAYLSGAESVDKSDVTFTAKDVTTLRDNCIKGQPSYLGTDILITSCWPEDITNLDPSPVEDPPKGSFCVSWLDVQIKPRYHFSPSPHKYYERPPYKNVGSPHEQHCTRFIALADVGNTGKDKWIYALSIEPIDMMLKKDLLTATTDSTNCPFKEQCFSQNLSADRPEQFFYNMNSSQDDGYQRKKRKYDDSFDKKRPKINFDQSKCWFCLSSPDVEKHLIISIGEEVYLALAKGGLTPDHALLLPVAHHQSTSDMPASIQKELNQFKQALTKMYEGQNKVPVFFERNYKTSHLQVQVIPVPSKFEDRLENIIQDNAESLGFTLDELPPHAEMRQVAPPGTPYFLLELPSGARLYHRIKKNFPIQFGREAIASEIFDAPEKADWKQCVVSKEEEIEYVKKFRQLFEPFDFTLTQ